MQRSHTIKLAGYDILSPDDMVNNKDLYQHATILRDAAKERLIRYTQLTNKTAGVEHLQENQEEDNKIDE